MSKSLNNAIGVDEPAKDQFGKMMRICDPLMWRYYELLSARSNEEIEALKAEADQQGTPQEAKKAFALEMVTRFHGEAAAQAAPKSAGGIELGEGRAPG